MGIAYVKLITYSQERFRTSNYSRCEVKSRAGIGVTAKKKVIIKMPQRNLRVHVLSSTIVGPSLFSFA